jgi:UDP-N-acetylmuramate dehydrogenase
MNKSYTEIETFLTEKAINFKRDFLIKYNTYFKMGGLVKLYIEPNNTNKFIELLKYLANHNIEFKIVGFTTNVFFFDEIEYSIVISTNNINEVQLKNNELIVDCGYALSDVVRIALINSAKGFEGLEGIPASVGGALMMNAGAYGCQISDNLLWVQCLDNNQNLITLNKSQCNFEYRNSIFKNNNFSIIKAAFKFENGNQHEIARKIEIYHIARHSYQEFAYPNLGSMISMTGDSYKRILKNSSLTTFFYWIAKLIFRNPVSKFIMRKRPNGEIMNKLIYFYFKNFVKVDFPFYLSNKNVNILINTGKLDSFDLIEYLILIHSSIQKKYHIENEVILDSIHKIPENYKHKFERICKILGK